MYQGGGKSPAMGMGGYSQPMRGQPYAPQQSVSGGGQQAAGAMGGGQQAAPQPQQSYYGGQMPQQASFGKMPSQGAYGGGGGYFSPYGFGNAFMGNGGGYFGGNPWGAGGYPVRQPQIPMPDPTAGAAYSSD